MNRRKDVELFEAIRRDYQFGVGTVKGVARKFGVHRRIVREALADAVPKLDGVMIMKMNLISNSKAVLAVKNKAIMKILMKMKA